jgi:hypothetical protein
MITYIHIPILVLTFFVLLSMWRFWISIHRMGYLREMKERAPFMLLRDILAAAFACMPLVIATTFWLGVTLPTQAGPVSPLLAAFMSLICMGTSIAVLGRSGERFAGHWAGTRKNALRIVEASRSRAHDAKETCKTDKGEPKK